VPLHPWIRFREKFFRIPTLGSDSKKKQLSKTKNIFYNAGGISDLLDPDPDQLTQMNPDLIQSRMIVAKDHLYLNVRQKSQFRGSNRRIFIMKGPDTHYSKKKLPQKPSICQNNEQCFHRASEHSRNRHKTEAITYSAVLLGSPEQILQVLSRDWHIQSSLSFSARMSRRISRFLISMEVWEQQYMKARRVGNPFGQDSWNVGKINGKNIKGRTCNFIQKKLYNIC
jgi:hypothetical protein